MQTMDESRITPVLLCGGSGTRLWPLSRSSHPKQFTKIGGEESLFQQTARRFAAAPFAPPLLLTHADYRFMVAQQLLETELKAGAIFLEPEARNTAPPVLAAALWLAARDPAALMLIAPTDHMIRDSAAFRAAVQKARPAALAGRIVTFGIRPERAETGYGWLETDPGAEGAEGTKGAEGARVQALGRFVEKPAPAQARAMLEAGNFLWNAGLFLTRADVLIAAFREHAPALPPIVEAALARGRQDQDFIRLEAAAWARAENISLDYAVMERAGNLGVLPLDCGWSDMGDWNSVLEQTGADEKGVALVGRATAIDCCESLLLSEDPRQEVVGIGLENTIVVAMPDAVLVADRACAQDVKRAVERLRRKAAPQAVQSSRELRPWGWFETLQRGPGFHVKQIHVHPGARLSLQSHAHRAEHWIIVAGTARAQIGDRIMTLHPGQSAHVPQGALHRLENPGNGPLVLIEVQHGEYLGEDDITRFEDIYDRA